MTSKQYPDCGALGSDASELTAFALSLRLIARMESEGHHRDCAKLMVAANTSCRCKGPTK